MIMCVCWHVGESAAITESADFLISAKKRPRACHCTWKEQGRGGWGEGGVVRVCGLWGGGGGGAL